MKKIINNQLSSQQLSDLDELCKDCKRIDGNTIATYQHILSQNRPISCNKLYYQQKRLIGFLSCFFFYEDACEIVLMVAPSARGRGLATQMLNESLPLLMLQQVKTLIFLTPNGLARDWLVNKGLVYKSSEYQMQRCQVEPVVLDPTTLIIRPATDMDLLTLCHIDGVCFPLSPLDVSEHFFNLLNNPNYRLFIAENEGEAIGKAHLSFEHDRVRLTNVGVLPRLQRHGFGRTLLSHCINYCLAIQQYKICLDVETNNEQALRLYARLGFSTNNAYDLWSISMSAFIRQ